jgi:Helix-turn-helix of DDE superfamily endonuclease
MKSEDIQGLSEASFRRFTGIKKSTYIEMCAALREAETQQKARGGKPNHLSIEIRLLLMLEYWREYRTYFHIGGSFGVSESTAFRTIRSPRPRAHVNHQNMACPSMLTSIPANILNQKITQKEIPNST